MLLFVGPYCTATPLYCSFPELPTKLLSVREIHTWIGYDSWEVFCGCTQNDSPGVRRSARQLVVERWDELEGRKNYCGVDLIPLITEALSFPVLCPMTTVAQSKELDKPSGLHQNRDRIDQMFSVLQLIEDHYTIRKSTIIVFSAWKISSAQITEQPLSMIFTWKISHKIAILALECDELPSICDVNVSFELSCVIL